MRLIDLLVVSGRLRGHFRTISQLVLFIFPLIITNRYTFRLAFYVPQSVVFWDLVICTTKLWLHSALTSFSGSLVSSSTLSSCTLLSTSMSLSLSLSRALLSDSLLSFFHFILLFWNHVFTCVSFKSRVCANWALLEVSRYFCSANVFSRTRSCRSVNTVRDFRHLLPLGVFKVGFTRK